MTHLFGKKSLPSFIKNNLGLSLDSRNFLLAVIGHPIAHSLSPQIFSYFNFYRDQDQRFFYYPLDVPPSQLPAYFSLMKQLPFQGFNVTLPHKEKIMSYLDEVSAEAQAIGAVNVVVRKRRTDLQSAEEKWCGYNTDYLGVKHTLLEHQIDVTTLASLILGTGGAAKATTYALAQMGCRRIFIQNRSLQKAESFCQSFRSFFPQCEFLAFSQASQIKNLQLEGENHLILNATPLGLNKNLTSPEGDDASQLYQLFFHDYVPQEGQAIYFFDLLYHQAETLFLKLGKDFLGQQKVHKLGEVKFINGLEMLLWQAIYAYHLFFAEESLPTPPLQKLSDSQIKSHLKNYLLHLGIY